MRNDRPRRALPVLVILAGLIAASAPTGVAAQTSALEELVSGVVRIKTFINPDGRTVENLGRERDGTGVVIDDDGLVLTIGYLMVEAHAAEVVTNAGRRVPATIVGYDHETGFGLLRASAPLKTKPLAFGKSADLRAGEQVLIASAGGASSVMAAHVVSRRPFAGNWEYLLDDAIYTSPPHLAWSGAALINREGKLVGIGSLVLGNVSEGKAARPGNMFVPIDRLGPVLGDLIAEGRSLSAPRPWLGLSTEDANGRLIISRVTPDGPAEKAGLRHGAVIVGVGGDTPKDLADFYRKLWALGDAGSVILLDVQEAGSVRRVEIKSMNRLDHLRLRSTF